MVIGESCRCLFKCCPDSQPTSDHPHPTSPPSPVLVWRLHLSKPSHAAAQGLWAPSSSHSPAPPCWSKAKKLRQTFSRAKVKRFSASVKSRAKEQTNLMSVCVVWNALWPFSPIIYLVKSYGKKITGRLMNSKEKWNNLAESCREKTTGGHIISKLAWHIDIPLSERKAECRNSPNATSTVSDT